MNPPRVSWNAPPPPLAICHATHFSLLPFCHFAILNQPEEHHPHLEGFSLSITFNFLFFEY
jgi:hypothetical protein